MASGTKIIVKSGKPPWMETGELVWSIKLLYTRVITLVFSVFHVMVAFNVEIDITAVISRND